MNTNILSGYKFYKNLDSFDHDIDFLGETIEEIGKKVNSNPNALAFNTIGYIKNKIDDLKTPNCFRNTERGLYVKNCVLNLEHSDKIRIKLLCNWCTSFTLCHEWKHMMSNPEKLQHYNLEFTWENDVDFFIIINKPLNDKEFFIENRTIVFHMEPWCYDETQAWGVKSWGKWARPDINRFLHVRTHDRYYNNAFWQLSTTYTDFKRTPIKKTKMLSSICSSKYFDPGHIKRIDFLKYIENKNEISLDIYNHDNNCNFKSYVGPHPPNYKDAGIMPYKYYFMAENNQEYNFITEKIWESILCECVCFYWGCENVLDYVNSEAIILLDLDDMEKSYNIVKRAIITDEWSRRIDVIRREKHAILDYYQFFATVERVLIHDMGMRKGITSNEVDYRKYFMGAGDVDYKLYNNKSIVYFLEYQNDNEYDIINTIDALEKTKVIDLIDNIYILVSEGYCETLDPSGIAIDYKEDLRDEIVRRCKFSNINSYGKLKFIEVDFTESQIKNRLISIYLKTFPRAIINCNPCYDATCDAKVLGKMLSDDLYSYGWNLQNDLLEDNSLTTESSQYNSKGDIIILNLERRKDRKRCATRLMRENNFIDSEYKFFSGVDGTALSITDFNAEMFIGNDFNSRKGVIGCALSHYNIWRELIESDKEYYVILEDDIELCNNFKVRLNTVLDNLDSDITYLGYTMTNENLYADSKRYRDDRNITINNFNVNQYLGGFFGYIITKDGATKMVEYIHKNGIKHGIDYLTKVNKNLTQKECQPHLVYSEWVTDKSANRDSDIQLSYDNFSVEMANLVLHSENYEFVIKTFMPFIFDNPNTKDIKNVCFLHSCYTDNIEILNLLVSLIDRSGLLEKLDYVFVVNIGNRVLYDHNKIKIINYSNSITLFEKPTINMLCNFSKYIDSIGGECNILYLHTKGTHSKGQEVIDWRDYMLYFLVEQWEYCIKFLTVYTSIGVNYHTLPHKHYSGNYWWTKSSYVKDKKIVTTPDRHDCEWYILNNDNLKQNNLSLNNSEINHYHEKYPRELYANEETINKLEGLLKTLQSNA